MAYPRNAPVRIPQNIGQLIEYTNPNAGVAFLRVDPNTGFVRRLTIPVLVQGRRQFVSLLKGKYNQNNAAHVNFATQQGQIFHQILNNVLMGMSAMVRGFDYGARIDFNGLHDDAYRGNKTLPNGNLSTQTLLRHLNVIMTSYTGFLEVQLAHTGISVFGIAGGRGAFVPLTSTCIETVRHTDIHPAKIVQHVSVLSEFATIYGDSIRDAHAIMISMRRQVQNICRTAGNAGVLPAAFEGILDHHATAIDQLRARAHGLMGNANLQP